MAGSASPSAMSPDRVRELIEAGLPGSHARVSGDGRHFDALVVAEQFEGRTAVQRHRMVYAAIGDHFDGEVLHALALRTLTPAERDR